MKPPILNLENIEYRRFGSGQRFGASRGPVSSRIGGEKLGYAVIRLEPGKRAWPYHAHRVIEEAFYIIEGQGTLRHAGEEYAIRAGDFIAAPADPEQAHQIINTSDTELVYIAISTQETTDVVHYPDSGKYGVWSGDTRDPSAPGNFRVFARVDTGVDYWDGETD
jgi:uncharacterized cupin superfamily protein